MAVKEEKLEVEGEVIVGVAEPHVQSAARQRARSVGVHGGQDEALSHPGVSRRSSSHRALLVRLDPRSDRLPPEVEAQIGARGVH